MHLHKSAHLRCAFTHEHIREQALWQLHFTSHPYRVIYSIRWLLPAIQTGVRFFHFRIVCCNPNTSLVYCSKAVLQEGILSWRYVLDILNFFTKHSAAEVIDRSMFSSIYFNKKPSSSLKIAESSLNIWKGCCSRLQKTSVNSGEDLFHALKQFFFFTCL